MYVCKYVRVLGKMYVTQQRCAGIYIHTSRPEAGPAHIRATSLPLSVPRRSLLSRSYLGWGIVPPFSSWRVFAEGAACG